MVTRYFVALYKTLISYSEFFCYFWMLFATLSKAGILYLVYPFLIFGYSVCEEQRPGRYFWFFIIIYTQFLIIINFVIQLEFWQYILSE